MTSDIYFNVDSWFPGNDSVKPHFYTQSTAVGVCGGGGGYCAPPHPRIFSTFAGSVSSESLIPSSMYVLNVFGCILYAFVYLLYFLLDLGIVVVENKLKGRLNLVGRTQ